MHNAQHDDGRQNQQYGSGKNCFAARDFLMEFIASGVVRALFAAWPSCEHLWGPWGIRQVHGNAVSCVHTPVPLIKAVSPPVPLGRSDLPSCDDERPACVMVVLHGNGHASSSWLSWVGARNRLIDRVMSSMIGVYECVSRRIGRCQQHAATSARGGCRRANRIFSAENLPCADRIAASSQKAPAAESRPAWRFRRRGPPWISGGR